MAKSEIKKSTKPTVIPLDDKWNVEGHEFGNTSRPYKVEYYNGDDDANSQHVSPEAKYFDKVEDAEEFVNYVKHAAGSARKGRNPKHDAKGINRGWRLEDVGGHIKHKPETPKAPAPPAW